MKLVTGTSLSVPPDVLLEGRWYYWNIMAFDNAFRDQIDYASVSETRNFFTMGGVTPSLEPLSVEDCSLDSRFSSDSS